MSAMRKAAQIPPQPWMTAPETAAVLDALTARGTPARFVGGCVRDAVAGRAVRDVDIATPEAPDEVTKLLADAGIKAIPTGIDHGTVTAVVDGVHFEVTTLRRDVETYGRRAKVAFTDAWDDDAARRDFTMNAIYADGDGTIYDPTGGLADLKAGRVRFVGDAETRIREDVPRLPPDAVDRIVAIFGDAGATAKVSSIHVNGWFGDYDKLGMTRMLMAECFGVDLDAERARFVFVGDSPNDSPMFAHFPHSVGVANVRDFAGSLESEPAYVTARPAGAGFAELADALLAVR